MNTKLIEIGGWAGMVCILTAFAMVSFSLLSPISPAYQVLNILGSTGVCIDAFAHRDKPAAVLNLVFLCIALAALVSRFIQNSGL